VPERVSAEGLRIGERLAVLHVFTRDEYDAGGSPADAIRALAMPVAGGDDCPASSGLEPRSSLRGMASTSTRVIHLHPLQFEGSGGDIAWVADQFGDHVPDPSSVLDVRWEVEARAHAWPQIPGGGQRRR